MNVLPVGQAMGPDVPCVGPCLPVSFHSLPNACYDGLFNISCVLETTQLQRSDFTVQAHRSGGNIKWEHRNVMF